jgi:hypothetical protein
LDISPPRAFSKELKSTVDDTGAWRHFKRDLPFLEAWQKSGRWKTTFGKSSKRRYFRRIFQEALTGAVDAWDYQWIG